MIPHAFSGVGNFILKMIIDLFAPEGVSASNLVFDRTVKQWKTLKSIVVINIVPVVNPLLRCFNDILIVGIDVKCTGSRVAHQFADYVIADGEVARERIYDNEVMSIKETLQLSTPALSIDK